MNRRRFVAASGIALSTAVTGCLGGPNDDSAGNGDDRTTNDPTTADGNGGDRTTSDGRTTTDERTPRETPTLTGTESVRFGLGSEPTGWDPESSVGKVFVLDSSSRASTALPLSDLPAEHADTVREFLAETDFERSVVLFVESAGPTGCHDELAVEEVRLASGELRAAASVVDNSDGAICTQAVTHPSTLVRATVDGRPPTSAIVSITDGWGDRESVTATASDPVGVGVGDLQGHVRPQGEPPAVPDPLSCEGFNRHPNWVDDPPWAASERDGEAVFGLRVDRTSVARGDEVTIRLTNVSGERQVTGNRYKYSLQIQTTDGWQDVRGSREKERFEYTDEAVIHEPGAGFEWTFEMSESGVVADHVHDLEVCPELPAGRYRFVFFEPGVAVAFDFEG